MDRQRSREKLAYILENYYHLKKSKVYLFLDGYPGDAIKTTNIRIVYSENKTADEMMKQYIEQAANAKNITVITSDNNLVQFAKVCSCKAIGSDDFSMELNKAYRQNDEQNIIDSMNAEEFKKIFNA